MKKQPVSKATYILASGLGIITWLFLANAWGYVQLPQRIIAITYDAGIVLSYYFLTAIFVKLSTPKVIQLLTDADMEHRILIKKIYTWLAYLFATSIVLVKLGLSAQQMALSLGILATGLAFAVRDIILSYISWFVLLVKKPFRIGDYIQIGEEEGRVAHIGTFYVLIDDNPQDGSYIRIPNKTFFEKPIKNHGHEASRYQTTFPLKKVPNEKELRSAEHAIRKLAGKDATLTLGSNIEHIWLEIEYTTLYENKHAIQDRIITTINKKLKEE